jgi:perosamine synthetase
LLLDTEGLGISRDDFCDRLKRVGIDTRPLFYPLHTMPPYQNCKTSGELANSKNISARGVSLPSAVTLTDSEIDHTISAIDRICNVRNLLETAG